MAGNLYVAKTCGIDYALPGKTTISYLPLAHLFEQMNELMVPSSILNWVRKERRNGRVGAVL